MATQPNVSFWVDGKALDVRSVVGDIRLSESFRFRVRCLAEGTDAVDPREWLGKPAAVEATPWIGPKFLAHGVVFAVQIEPRNGPGATQSLYEFTLAPASVALEIGREHRYFQEMSAPEILREIINKAGLEEDASFALTASYAKRPYTVQAGESDWVFLSRLLAEEGISYRYDFENDKTRLVFFDETPQAPEVVGGPILVVTDSGLEADRDAVHGLMVRRTARISRVVLRDYEPGKPGLNQEVDVSASDGKWSEYNYPGRYRVPADGKGLAQRRLESLRSAGVVIEGRVTNPRTWPGRIVDLDGSPFAEIAKLMITSMHLSIAHRTDEEAGRAEFRFTATPAEVPHRPDVRPSAAPVRGPQTAVVVGPSGEELHTDDVGRIRAQFRWDRSEHKDHNASTPMRVGQFPLGNSMVRPRVGWDLIVEHQAGDADSPMILSHLYDGAHPPPYPLPANKTRTSWQTATSPGGGSSNEIRFEDKKGAEEIFLNASKNMDVAIGDKKFKKVGNDHTHEIGADSQVSVGTARSIGVTADQSTTIGSSETLSVAGSRTVGINGGETTTVGGSRDVTTIMGKTLEANGGRSMTVGGNLMDISALGVNRAVLGSASVTVGSAWISAAASGLGNMTGGAGAETVGGVKLQVGVGGVSLGVKGALAETVGAAYVGAAGGNYGEVATGNVSFLVGGAFIVNAPSIEIEAESEIVFSCGGASLTIKSGSIEVRAPTIPTPAGMIGTDGSKVQHNP